MDESAHSRNERHVSAGQRSGSDPGFRGAAAELENVGRNDPGWRGSGKKFKKSHGAGALRHEPAPGTIAGVTEQVDDRSLPEQLEEIRTQLAWVRDYL